MSCSDQQMAELLTTLVETNTVNPPGNEKALAQTIAALLAGAGLPKEQLALVEHGNGRASLVATLPGTRPGVQVGFCGHLDTVPAGSPGAWSGDPFRARLENGVLTARGAADMKGGLCAMLLLCLHFLENAPPPVTLQMLFTADEESGGMGITALREAGYLDELDFLFICEPTDCRPGVAEKGVLWLEYHLKGQTSHASMATLGVNAAEHGFALVQRTKAEVEALYGTSPVLGQNSFSLTTARAGVKMNVIPDEAVLGVDVRTVPHPGGNRPVWEKAGELARQYQAAVPGLVVDITCLNDRAAIETDQNHPAVKALLELCAVKVPGGGALRGVNFFTDGSLVTPHYPGLPFIILGPGSPQECHTPEEKIPLAQVRLAYELYRAFVETDGLW